MQDLSESAHISRQEYPLSYGQRALWFVQQLRPEGVAHNVVHAVQLNSQLELNIVKKTWQYIVDRHPVLRTTFHEINGEPFQRVHPQVEISITVEEASDWDRTQLDERLAREVFRPFDLAEGPLLRVIVFKRFPRNHIMVVAQHHSITDLWSLALMIAEFEQVYSAYEKGHPPKLKPLRHQYRNYVDQQKKMLDGPDGEFLWQYWRKQLAGDLPVLELPVDRPRPTVQNDRGAACFRSVPAQLTRQLESLARLHHTTLFKLIFAAFSVLLHRCTGQDDILIGTPKTGRTHRFARVMGYFINPVVIRADCHGNPTFLDFLHRIDQTVENANKHDAFPFPLLVERLTPRRELSHSPLFQVMFAWQKTTAAVERSQMAAFTIADQNEDLELEDSLLGPVFLKDRTSPFDLAIWMAEASVGGKKQLRCTLEYKIDLFNRETIERILDVFLNLLSGVVADPDAPISKLPLLIAAEEQRLQANAAAPSKVTKTATSVLPLFDDRVHRAPEAVAVTGAAKQLTYRQLDRESNRLAKFLRDSGVAAQTPVGVCVERSLEAMVALMGILKAGGTYVPLDPRSPADRLAFMIGDSRIPVLLTQRQLLESLPEVLDHVPCSVFCLDSDWATIAAQNADPLECHVEKGHLAYVIYTSGSTGIPKAVAVPHGTFAKHCLEMCAYYGMAPRDRVLQFAALNFDASLEQIFTTFLTGAELVLMDRDIWPPAGFAQKVEEYQLSVVNIPPVYFQHVLNACTDTDNGRGCGQLRLIILGADVVSPSLLQQWRQSEFCSARLINAYGPTETTITATAYEAPTHVHDTPASGHVPIGRALPGRSAYVLDRYGNLAPTGVPGELYLGGGGLADGYLNRPDLTAEAYVPDPFSGVAGARLYRTGDLARRLVNHEIEFLGRIDHQVKIRGFRIEIGEVEAVLNRHPSVLKAVVVSRKDVRGDQTLVAFFTAASDLQSTPDDLRRFLKRYLPDYMLPSAFIPMEELPLTSGGKVDRRGLLEADIDQLESTVQYVAPRSPLESELAQMTADLLQCDRVGVNDNFFSLGGHSLLATQMISRIRAGYGVEIPLRQFFEQPTVNQMAKAIEDSLIIKNDPDQLAQILAELESMSDLDAKDQFRRESGGN